MPTKLLPEGSIYRRKTTLCLTCNVRHAKTRDRERCEAAGHTLKERTSPIWWVSYRTPEGWKDESSRSAHKVDAQRLLRDRNGSVDRGTHHGRWSFAEAKKAALLDYKTNGRRSIDVFERRIVKHLEPVFGEMQLAEITTTAIREFQSARQEAGASNAEINRELDALSKMFRLAIQDGRIFAKPAIPKLKEPAARKHFVTDAEYLAVYHALEPHMRGIWQFLFLTGWRSTEALTLRWEHVGEAEIRFTGQTKADEPARTIAITPQLKALFESQRALQRGVSTPWVFSFVRGRKMAGRPISYNGFNKARKAAVRSNPSLRPDLIAHDNRRTAADRMVRVGIDEGTAMRMGGWKTPSVFRRYAITSAPTLQAAAAKLASVPLPKAAKGRKRR
jgi:integrase